MNEFILPAVVPAGSRGQRDRPAASIASPRRPTRALFSLPTADGGWDDLSRPASSTARSSPSRRASSPRASSPARRSASCARPATSGRSSTSPPGSPVRCSCRSTRRRSPSQVNFNLTDSGAIAIIVETRRPLRALRRGAPRAPAGHASSGRSTSATSTSSRRPAPGVSRRGARDAAATSRWAPTSRRSSTRRARPAGRRAACSPTPTSSS